MRKADGKWILSPRDLIAELECDHRLNLEWSALTGLIDKPKEENSAGLELIIQNGRDHETRLVEKYKAGNELVSITEPGPDINKIDAAFAATKDAINRGIPVIHQAVLYTGDFLGYADFLILVKDQSGNPIKDEQGRFIYEPVDAKSARVAKRAAVLQVASYARAMVRIGMATPPKVRLWLAGDEEWEAATADLIDLAEEFENRARARIESFTAINSPNWAAPREACIRCRWTEHCTAGREKDRDLSLIYGIRSTTRTALLNGGITTIEDMSQATEEQRKALPKLVTKETFEKLKEQARIQIEGEGIEPPIYEVINKESFSLIPPPSSGDIWFDIEGDPFSEGGEGLEYMFGFVYHDGNQLIFNTFEAENTTQEREAFSNFVTFAMERRRAFPDMHIYHYAAYEQTALRRLCQKFGVHEKDVDYLLRNNVLVDLLPIVRNSLRFSTDSYSLKALEPVFYPNQRKGDVTKAIDSMVIFNAAYVALVNGNRPEFEARISDIRDYNEVDCYSLQALNNWLLARQAEYEVAPADNLNGNKEEKERPTPEENELRKDLPADISKRTSDEHGRALIAAAMKFHSREVKPGWWEFFDRAESEIEELYADEDVVMIQRVESGKWIPGSGNTKDRRDLKVVESNVGDFRNYFDQGESITLLYLTPHEARTELMGTPRSYKNSTIEVLDADYITVSEKCNVTAPNWSEFPIAIIPNGPIKGDTIDGVIQDELCSQVLANKRAGVELFPKRAWADLVLRRPPRQRSGTLPQTGDPIKDITKALLDSQESYVAVQGPPGTGKTHVGVHVIAELVNNHGWKVGVVAQSHNVIEHLLDGILKSFPNTPIAKKGRSNGKKPSYHQENIDRWASQQESGFVIGGTAWSFADSKYRNIGFDLMVVEEAGQFSLANTIAAVSCARTALLLGDPQQLPQVSQAAHPEPVNQSALQHIIGSEKTMPSQMGYFLETTYRLHPNLAKPVSRLQYEEKLHSDPRCARRHLEGVDPGLHIVRIDHTGNITRSEEEGQEIVRDIKKILGRSWTDTDKDGNPIAPRHINESDILVVTAYNSQLKLIKGLLRANGWPNIQVGTFDKFQGREAPVVFVSMTTSTSEELPRGMEFLLLPNRLNVAVSRAKWACYLIRSTNLSFMQPTKPEGMIMLGKFVTLCTTK